MLEEHTEAKHKALYPALFAAKVLITRWMCTIIATIIVSLGFRFVRYSWTL